jgi:hypothetical protein
MLEGEHGIPPSIRYRARVEGTMSGYVQCYHDMIMGRRYLIPAESTTLQYRDKVCLFKFLFPDTVLFRAEN